MDAMTMARLRHWVRRFRCNRGAELIEMAMVTPLLLLIFGGIIDFAMMFRSWEVVTNAAREGARVGVLPAYGNDENVRVRVEQYMQVSGVAAACSLGTISAGRCPSGACTVCVQLQNFPTGAGTYSARVVTVTSTQNLQSLSWIADLFGGNFGALDVSSTSAMRTEVAGTAPPPAP